jgi:hypothetical protein
MIEWRSLEIWQNEGLTSIGNKSHKIVCEILNSTPQQLLPGGMLKEMSKLMMNEAGEYGMSSLSIVRLN